MIRYYNENIAFKFSNKRKCNRWIKNTILEECNTRPKKTGEISIVFCSDDYILNINKQFLKHDYFTDIITFDNSYENTLSADIFISIETVKGNAIFYNQDFLVELHRVIIHGILHILKYDDQTKCQKKEMKEREDYYLSKYFSHDR
jgi:probable rRNA maturation factor